MRNVSRSSVAQAARTLRKSNGQFNGSIGSGQEPKTGLGKRAARLAAEKQRLREELSPAARKRLDDLVKAKGVQPPGKAKPSPTTATNSGRPKPLVKPSSDIEHYQSILDGFKSKSEAELTITDKFNRKLAQTRLSQLQRDNPATPTPNPRVNNGDVITDRIPKHLNPQEQTNSELPPQTAQTIKKTKLSVSANIDNPFQADIAFDKTTTVELDTNFRYKVNHNGKDILLNDNALTIKYGGETVKGIPNIVASFKDTDNTTLVEKIALAEREVKKGRAPSWNKDEHGAIVDDSELVGKSTAAGGTDYRGMQIHHVGQWAKHSAFDIEADFKAGKIDEAERERRYLDTIEKRASGSNAEWQLKIKPQGEREFVILPGGLHQGGTPLYKANHPYFYDPTAKKFTPIGIPEDGLGGRKWFETKYRSQFWKEYAKVQLKELAAEANARVKAGKMSPADAKRLYTEAVDKMAQGSISW